MEPADLVESSFGIFVSDSSKDQELFLMMRQLAHAALQNQQAELSDVVKMFSSESTSEIRTLLEKAEDKRNQQQAQQAQQAQEAQMAQVQATQQIEAQKLELDKYKIDEDNATKIAVAEINSFRNQMDQDSNDNGIPDQLEIEKLKLQAEQVTQKNEIENRKLDIKEEELNMKEKTEKEKRKHEKEEKAKDRKEKKKS